MFTIKEILKQNQFKALLQNQGRNLPFPDFHVSHITIFLGTIGKYIANNFIIKDSQLFIIILFLYHLVNK